MNRQKNIKNILNEQFQLDPLSVANIPGGWSAEAWLVENYNGDIFLLKVYDRSRTSTLKLTSYIDDYMPVIDWLNSYTSLSGRIITPLRTNKEQYKYDDASHIYILLKYIEGCDLIGKTFKEREVVQLAQIISELHNYGEQIEIYPRRLKEDFGIDFSVELSSLISPESELKPDLKALLTPYINIIGHNINLLNYLAVELKLKPLKYVICHTDIHEGNIIRGTDGIYLIDWEGMKLAPPEADLFMLTEKPWFDLFYRHYRKFHKDYIIDKDILGFYKLRRVLEDIWEFVEQLQFDDLTPEQRLTSLNHLNTKCQSQVLKDPLIRIT